MWSDGVGGLHVSSLGLRLSLSLSCMVIVYDHSTATHHKGTSHGPDTAFHGSCQKVECAVKSST